MKKLTVSILCTAFLFAAGIGNLRAQSSEGGENYYSNPQKGINPTAPKPYSDNSVASKTDDIVVELTGTVKDTTPQKDTTRLKLKSIPEYSRGENPRYWGTNIYYSWDPWYSPYWNGWYYPGWGGSHWMLTYSWGMGPYWSFGLGWSWGWGSPWWYWDPWYSPYYYGYYGYYGWGGYAYGWGHYHDGWARNSYYGHGYLGGSNHGAATSPTFRGSANPSPARPVRRGGVDLNNGGRAPRGSISGTGSRGNTAVANGSSRGASNNAVSNGRYAKPASVTSNRAARNAARSSYSNGMPSQRGNVRQTGNSGRGTYGTSTTGSRYDNNRSSSRFESNRSSRFDNSSSYRQSSSRSSDSFRSSGSSNRSGGFSSGSSNRSGGFSSGSSSRGGGYNSGSSSRGGGGGHSSGRR